MLAKTTIDVNSTTNDGMNSIRLAISDLDAAKLLVEKGANLFLKDDEGRCAIDDDEHEPTILQYAKDLRFASVRSLFLLSSACTYPNTPQLVACSFLDDDASILSRSRSARLVASVLGSFELSLIIA